MTATIQPNPVPPPPPPAGDAPPPHSSVGRTLVIIVGAVVTASAIGWGVFSLVGLVAHQEETSAVSFPGRVTHLVVRVDDGVLRLRGTDDDHVSGTRRVSRGLAAPHISETVAGDTLTIRADCPTLMSEWCSVGYTLDVPREVSVVASSSGDRVEANGVHGDLDLHSSAGGVRVTDASGTLTLDSSAGEVEATGLSSQVVNARSTAGGVTLSFDRPPDQVEAHSSAGPVEVTVPRSSPAYRVSAHSSAGSTKVDVRTDPNSSRTLAATSSAGPVTVQYGAS